VDGVDKAGWLDGLRPVDQRTGYGVLKVNEKGTRSPGRATKTRGLGYWHYNSKFGWIYRSYPKPKPGPPTLKQQAARQQLASAAYVAKRIFSYALDFAKEQTGNEGWTWKDYYISALYGRSFEIRAKDGTIYRSLREVTEQAQQLLDSITNAPGSFLVRTADGWVGFLKGSDGQVLVTRDSSIVPVWETLDIPSGVQGQSWQYVYIGTSAENDSQASLGEIINFDWTQKIWSVSFQVAPTTSATYRVGVAPFDKSTNKMTADPIFGVDQTIVGTGAQHWLNCPFIEDVEVTAGTDYIFFVNRNDGSDTSVLNVFFNTAASAGPGIANRTRTLSGAKVAKKNPTTSDVWTRINGFYGMTIGYSDPQPT
jgi:hypothetical protein